MGIRGIIGLASLATLAALPAAAVKNELTSVVGATLGTSPAEVRKVFPKMEPTTENLGSQPFDSEFLARYAVKDVRDPNSGKPALVELRFWKDKLWAVIVYYGDGSGPKVIESLTKRLGPPNGNNPQKPSWNGEKSQVFVETEHNWYSLTDNALSKDAQSWFYARLQQMQQQLAPAAATAGAKQAAATPVVSPAAPAATPAAPATK